MTVADFSTIAIYVDVRTKNPWSISCVLFVHVHAVNLHLYQGMCSKQGPTLRELCLHFRSRTFRQGTELKYKQTTVLDKSGHGCGRFNEIKANRITTHRYM